MKRPQIPPSLHGLGFAVVLAAVTASPAAAQIGVEVNGRPVSFGAVAPQRIGGRVLIPLRAVVEALGAEVNWDPSTQTIHGHKGERQFFLRIGQRSASVNGESVGLDVPAQLISGNTMVPLRFVAEALGAEVEWNAATQQVVINGGGGETPVADAGRLRGEVVAVQPGANATITVRTNGMRQTYRVTRDTIVLRGEEGRRGAAVDLDQVRPGDTANLRVNADRGTAEVVEAYPRVVADVPAPRDPRNPDARDGRGFPPRDPNTIYGEVIAVRPRGNRATLIIQTRTGRESVDVPRDAEITRAIGRRESRPAVISDVQVGDRVRVTPGADGVVTRVFARAADPNANDTAPTAANRTVTGEIVAVRPRANPPTIIVQTATGRKTLEVSMETDIFRTAGRAGRAIRASLSDLEPGDQVRIRTDPRGAVAEVIDVEGQ